MSDFLQLTDPGNLYPRQFSMSIFGRQDSSMNHFVAQSMYKAGPILHQQQGLLRQSSIDALFAPMSHQNPGFFYRSPSMASDSLIQTSIDETNIDYNDKQPNNQQMNQYSNVRYSHHQPAYFSDVTFPAQPPMLPDSPASSSSSSASQSPQHGREQSYNPAQMYDSQMYDSLPPKDELLSQFASNMSRELTASTMLPQVPPPAVRYQFNYNEPESSEVDESELEFSPIANTRQVWSTPAQRRTLGDVGPTNRQRFASGEIAFTAQQQAMVTAWSNHQAKMVHLPPALPQVFPKQSEAVDKAEPSPKRARIEEHKHSSSSSLPPPLPSLTKLNSSSISSRPLLPPGVDPNEIVIGTYTRAERAAKIARYREKRARRKWTKKIMYDCRKSFADNRPRVGGRFIKMKDLPQTR